MKRAGLRHAEKNVSALNIRISPILFETIKKIAEHEGTTFPEVAREALELYAFPHSLELTDFEKCELEEVQAGDVYMLNVLTILRRRIENGERSFETLRDHYKECQERWERFRQEMLKRGRDEVAKIFQESDKEAKAIEQRRIDTKDEREELQLRERELKAIKQRQIELEEEIRELLQQMADKPSVRERMKRM